MYFVFEMKNALCVNVSLKGKIWRVGEKDAITVHE